jgi:hypothetical protein
LRTLLSKYDKLSDFGKEMLFCFMVGYGDMFDDQQRFDSLIEEMDKWTTKEI